MKSYIRRMFCVLVLLMWYEAKIKFKRGVSEVHRSIGLYNNPLNSLPLSLSVLACLFKCLKVNYLIQIIFMIYYQNIISEWDGIIHKKLLYVIMIYCNLTTVKMKNID